MDTIGTQLAVPTSEVDATQLCAVGTADSVLIREVSFIQSVLYREVSLYMDVKSILSCQAWSLPFQLQRRRKLAEKWSATVLQRSTEKWFSMKKAKRLHRAQELRREQSAKLIQQHWRKYIAKKRRYEAQLVRLKSRIKQ